MIDDLHWQDATEIARLIREREIKAVDVLEHFLARVDRINPTLNAIVTLDKEGARKRAAEADAALARGELWGPLHGVPATLKDTFEVAGMRCTAGSEMLQDHVPGKNAVAVQRMIDAGAVIFGKTNVPPFAGDLQTRNTLFGITGNAWNPDRIAGGSSGGSAVALAAGLTPVELGSDIGGSSRNPAHYNSIFGMRPTWNTISGMGHIPGLPGSLAVDELGSPGPMARSARDLRLIFDIVRGSSPAFGHVEKPVMPEQEIDGLAQLRVAVWIDNDIVPVDESVRKVLDQALKTLAGAGLSDVRTAQPDFNVSEAYDLYIRLGGAVTGSDLPAEQREGMAAQIEAARAAGDQRGVARMEGVLMSYAEWAQFDKLRGKHRAAWHQFFQDFDVLLTPIMSLAAISHGENYFGRTISINGEEHIGGDQLFWSGLQVTANLPSVVFPAGFTEENMPVGFQVTAPFMEDYRAIRVAELMAEAVGVHQLNPALAE